MAETAKGHGLSLMIDLVITHRAEDSKLVQRHPDWFVREQGRLATPSASGKREQGRLSRAGSGSALNVA
jgi:starch synthase (maltosyl-transferring)